MRNELDKVLARHRYLDNRGAFFGSANGRPFGAGLILDNCPVPFYLTETKAYAVGRGCVCVLTHECDIDPQNERAFNDKLLVVPIIDFRAWYSLMSEEHGAAIAEQVGTNVVADKIYRVLYLPTIPRTDLAYGGILYLNEITNVSLDDIKDSTQPVCSLTSFSDRLLRFKLENHLFRPKSEPLMAVN